MSDEAIIARERRGVRRLGFGVWGLTGLFVALYLAVPALSDPWPAWAHQAFRAAVVGGLLVGGVGVAAPWWPKRWQRAAFGLARHRVFHLPREGIGYLLIMGVLFIGSSLTGSNTLMLVFAAMAGPFVVNGWVTYTMLKNVRVTRRTPVRAMAGELFSVQVEASNRLPLVSMWLMVIQDEITYGDDRWEPTVLFTRIPAMSTQIGHYQVRLLRRGRHHFGPVHVTSRFPLGLVERGNTFRELGEMLIYPRIGRLSSDWKRQLLGASELIETPQTRNGVFEDEYHHLREYRSGDNPRAIHWRSSARRNTLIIRQYQQSREHHLLLAIDLHADPRDPAQLDLAEKLLSLAATIAAEHRRECRGATLTVLAAGQEPWRWAARANAVGLESLLDRMAVLEPAAENQFATQFHEALVPLGPTTRVVVVSSRAESAALAGLHGPASHGHIGWQWLKLDAARFGQYVQFPDDRPRPKPGGGRAGQPQTTPAATKPAPSRAAVGTGGPR